MCRFAAKQLRLGIMPANARRYSTMLLSTAMIWARTSAKLYDDIQESGLMILPHKTTLRRLTSGLNVKEGLDEGTKTYMQMRINKLDS